MPHDLLVAGEALVDFVPASASPLADVESFTRRAGGAPANVAVGLATLGEPPLFWTRVGDDAFGDHLLATLRHHGVPTEFVERDPDAATALAFVAHDEDGDRSFTFYRDDTADTRLEPERVDDAALDDCGWVHVGGVTLTAEPARSATYGLVERAAERGATVSVDPNARPELWTDHDYADSLDRLLDSADVVTASFEDLQAAGFGGHPADVARAVCERGPHTAFVTLGGGGALAHATGDAPWAGDGTESVHDGFDVDAVDTTGAGDAFTAGAIASLRAGEPLPEALDVASAVAALTTTQAGAMAALPDRGTVEEFRAERS